MIDLATVGGLFLAVCLGLVVSFDSPSIVFLAFLFMVAIAPPLSAALIFWSERSDAAASRFVAALRLCVKIPLLWLLLVVLIYMLQVVLFGQTALRARSSIPGAVAIATVAVPAVRLLSSAKSFSPTLDACLIVAVGLFVFALSPFNPNAAMPVGLLEYALAAPKFWIWMLLGIAWTATGIWLRRREGWAFGARRRPLEIGAITLAVVFVLLLYDDTHFTDFSHYMVLVGPAVHAARGGVPMVDVYSIYGLGTWLVHLAMFEVFQPTFGTAAVTVRLINLLYFGVIVATLMLVSRRRLSALWFFVPAMFVALTSHGTGASGMWNMNALPMTLGGRNLLPAAMALLMVASRGREWGAWAALPLLMLASLASVEILIFALAPWGYCLLLDAVRVRSPRLFATWILAALASVAAAQFALVATVYLRTGAMIDYQPYFSLFFQFRPAEESIWSVPFVPYYALWLPIGFAYFAIMALAGLRALRGDSPVAMVDRLLPVAAFGLGPLAYFMGRPQEATLNVICLPFAIVAICIAQIVFVKSWRYGRGAVALSGVLACTFAFVTANGFEHFMRAADPGKGNATILRRCLSAEGCRLGEVGSNIRLALHSEPLDPRTGVGYGVHADGHHERIEEVVAMLRRLAPGARTVGMLADLNPHIFADSDPSIGIAAFMYTGQWYAWSISSPINDGVSPLLTARILQSVSATPSGMVIIAPIRPDDWAPLNKAILERLRETCDFRLLETGRYHRAFVTEGCRK